MSEATSRFTAIVVSIPTAILVRKYQHHKNSYPKPANNEWKLASVLTFYRGTNIPCRAHNKGFMAPT